MSKLLPESGLGRHAPSRVIKNDGMLDKICLACHRVALTDDRNIFFSKNFLRLKIGIGQLFTYERLEIFFLNCIKLLDFT